MKPDQDFSLTWNVPSSAETRLRDIAAATAGCQSVILATDPDREGEAISWHITQELKVNTTSSSSYGGGGEQQQQPPHLAA